MESFMEDINIRIARLSIALGISLQKEEDVAAVIHQLRGMSVTEDRRSAPERRAGERAAMSAERRKSYFRSELRGLLVLRYGVEQRLVEQMGFHETRQILAEAEAHLTRSGFQPGVAGMQIDQHFETK
jgi:hypothetical protein